MQSSGKLDSAGLFRAALRHHQDGELGHAADLYRQCLVLEPAFVAAHVNLGCALIALGAHEEAAASLRQAIRLQPASAEAHNNLGLALEQQGDVAGATLAYDQAARIAPRYADAWFNLGNLHLRRDELDRAACCYRTTLEIEPTHAGALFNLGNIFLHRKALDDAITHYRQALAQKPDLARAQFNLASALCQKDCIEEGFAAFSTYAARFPSARAGTATPLLPHKIRHDQEQQDHLAGENRARGEGARIDAGAALASPAVNPANVLKASETWHGSNPQIVVVDDFLTPEALDALRRFCWDAAIWNRVHADGYIGAMPEDGFSSPLVAQIVREMRGTFPAILAPHAFQRLAAFKYDGALAGLGIHADTAAVNVNFWITADEANLDPQGGGMVIWDVPAPLDWKHATYNGDPAACRAFLEQAGARPTTIPYRANRAVIFDSDLFHQTDRIAFRPGYRNRRTSISMLYGHRGG